MLTRIRNRQKGFTLIELLIVIAIIGIIAALLIPNFLDALQKAKQKRTVADVRNTGTTLKRCADLVREAGGTVIGTMQIIDRCEACVSLDVPNVTLVEYKAPPNYAAGSCPMCAANVPITTF